MPERLVNPAVIVNAETAGIGIIHSLHLGGVAMATVERNWPPALGRFSRFPKVRTSYRSDDTPGLVDALLRFAERFEGRGVLFPSTDADLEQLILGADRLSTRYHVPASPQIGVRIFEKNWQYQLAERAGVPIPTCVRFRAGESPPIEGFRFPLILKPSSRADAAGDRVFRLRILPDPQSLGATLDEIARDFPEREFQVAENIPGEPDQLYTIGSYSDRAGRVVRSYSGRKLTQYPYYHGMASVAETALLPERVFEQARRLLEEARFHGISQVEFKYDPRDDQYKLLEINGRSWLWVKLAAFSGVNLPLIQYYDLTGDPRLESAVGVPQENRRFFVFDHHVKLNDLESERSLIRQMRAQKQVVSAMDAPGDWTLSAAHRLLGGIKRLRQRRTTVGTAATAVPSSVSPREGTVS